MSVFRIKKTENFVTLHKEALENTNLSFKAKGLWAYCMSRPNDWTFRITHLATISKENKDAISSAIKELEREGYIKKIQERESGKFQPVDYEVYETSQLNKCLPLTDFPVAEKPLAGNPPLLKIDSTKDRKEKNIPSAVASELSLLLLETIRKSKEDFADENLKTWAKDIDKILAKKTPEAIKKVLAWIPTDDFWAGVIFSAKQLKAHFEALESKMRKGPSKVNEALENAAWATKIRQDFQVLQDMEIYPDYLGFRMGHAGDLIIKYTDANFKDQVINRLRKMGFNVEGL